MTDGSMYHEGSRQLQDRFDRGASPTGSNTRHARELAERTAPSSRRRYVLPRDRGRRGPAGLLL